MKKKAFIACGCVVVFVAIAVLVIVAVHNSVPSPLSEEQQKALVQELTQIPGTALRDGTGIMVIVDVSGSMNSSVPDTGGQRTKKIEIARRVARRTIEAIHEYTTKNPDKLVEVGLTKFGSHASTVLPVAAPPDLFRLGEAIEGLTLEGATAIGEAMVSGKKQLNQSALKKQFMIVITDGTNTAGRAPQDVVKALNTLPTEERPTLYLVAFDIEAKKFQPLTDQGVLVSEARDGKGLQGALDYILYEKIFVEQE